MVNVAARGLVPGTSVPKCRPRWAPTTSSPHRYVRPKGRRPAPTASMASATTSTWFRGRRLLERPLELMLADGQPDLPYCVYSANEPWTRRWDGREDDVLMAQRHDRHADVAILDDLMPLFEDARYIRIDDRPLLLVYRPGIMPDRRGSHRTFAKRRIDVACRGCFSATFCPSAKLNVARRDSTPRSNSRPTARLDRRSNRLDLESYPASAAASTTTPPRFSAAWCDLRARFPTSLVSCLAGTTRLASAWSPTSSMVPPRVCSSDGCAEP